MTTGAMIVAVVVSTLGCGVLCSRLVPVARRFAMARGAVAVPNERRWSSVATPSFGGLAIVGALGIGIAIAVAVTASVSRLPVQVVTVVLASALVVIVGAKDDLRPASIGLRVAVEVIAALVMVSAGISVRLVGGPVDVGLTVAFVVVVMNACNYLDNMDGALGTIGAALAAVLAVFAMVQGQYLVAIAAAGVVGSCVGFLVHNWHPASIFMGDAGSLFLGFALCVLALKIEGGADERSAFTGLVVTFAVPLFDMTLVYSSRARGGRPIHVGGVDHTAHRLVGAGMSVTQVSALLGGATLITATAGSLVRADVVDPRPVFGAVLATGCAALWALRAASGAGRSSGGAEGSVTPG